MVLTYNSAYYLTAEKQRKFKSLISSVVHNVFMYRKNILIMDSFMYNYHPEVILRMTMDARKKWTNMPFFTVVFLCSPNILRLKI